MERVFSVSIADETSGTSLRSFREAIGEPPASVSPTQYPMSQTIPLNMDAGQAYYWQYAWQVGEQESRAELAAGEGRTFPDAEAAIRWLLSDHG